MHFFSPANVMKLLENVRTDATDAETLVTIMDLGKRLQKVCILVGVCFGFVSNRMSLKYQQQVEFLLEEGALPAQIDKALKDFGFAMGPCEVCPRGLRPPPDLPTGPSHARPTSSDRSHRHPPSRPLFCPPPPPGQTRALSSQAMAARRPHRARLCASAGDPRVPAPEPLPVTGRHWSARRSRLPRSESLPFAGTTFEFGRGPDADGPRPGVACGPPATGAAVIRRGSADG